MNDPVSVREVMNREYVGASASDGLVETTELLVREGEPTALVLEGNDPVGVVSRADILGHLVSEGSPEDAIVDDVMTDSYPSIGPEARLPEARDRMATYATQWLVVVEDGEPLGTLTGHDILSSVRLESERTQTVEEEAPMATSEQATADGTTAAEDSFEEQGICSACGTLTRSLASLNGQLLCADCRDV
ncbi:CBS domain-containing protein [Haloarcula salinisoli]|uniref:CBS domain-containing protein n=1 Tax=Haloarcula salinisoli TaxID=2487746 RepID=A0A8J8C7I1_9EURY|nr:CBS domain-containing protein [Halomicroarcula salinisoli]MBX0285225.1 CBS domain-containing protein [Halomicroarcula salinisoli]MBX0303297.1 CBS domain-containing protein [Halomicroarcula salinisoli]